MRDLLQRRAPEKAWSISASEPSAIYCLTIQESEENEECNPENVRKLFDISNLKRDEHRCGEHDCCHSKAVGIGELSGVVEDGDKNNGRYDN